MAGVIMIGLLGVWLVVQSTSGRLPARVLSYRAPDAGVPTITAAGYGNVASSSPASSSPSSSGTVLTIDQVARVALNAGLRGEAAAIATAIAMRESSGNTAAHNPVPPDDSYGLWQINRLAWPQYSPAELSTAEGNARAMMRISNGGTNWGPWTTAKGVMFGTDITAARAAVNRAMGGS